MPLLLDAPELQFIDANGAPYAGGTVETYIPGTDTLKDTWADHAGTVLNTHPIVLDAAGRCLLFGSGDYRLVLKDAAGNLIYDQWTSSIVSTAMQPVVAAATLADARTAMGISDVIQTETNRAEAAEANLQTAINNEVTTRGAADGNIITDLNNESARAQAAEANLQNQITGGAGGGVKAGSGSTDGTAHTRITYPTPFANATDAFTATLSAGGLLGIVLSVVADRFGADVWSVWSYGAAAPSANFYWLASGH